MAGSIYTLVKERGKVVAHIVPPLEVRLFQNINKIENGCWEWIGRVKDNGYAVMGHKNKSVYAHRFSYEFHKGKIPEGLEIDHLCRNRRCVNPDHLEAVTSKENNRRGLAGPGLTCGKGHPFDAENSYYPPNGRSRQCRMCAYLRTRISRNYQKIRGRYGPRKTINRQEALS